MVSAPAPVVCFIVCALALAAVHPMAEPLCAGGVGEECRPARARPL